MEKVYGPNTHFVDPVFKREKVAKNPPQISAASVDFVQGAQMVYISSR